MVWSPLARLFGNRRTPNTTMDRNQDDQYTTVTGQRNLNRILQDVVDDVVNRLGYIGALVAIVDTGEDLQIRAHGVSTQQINAEENNSALLEQLLQAANLSTETATTLTINLLDRQYQENIGVKASLQQALLHSRDLYNLFTPFIPEKHRNTVDMIQAKFNIAEVAALPFFLNQEYDGAWRKEQVGLLVVVSDKLFDDEDVQMLSAVGRQTASAIESEQRRIRSTVAQEIVSLLHLNMNDEQVILQNIVKGVVEELDFVGAIVATYEDIDDSLPVRALYLDPTVATMNDIHTWERRVSQLAGTEVSLTDPARARVYMDDAEYENNLSWKAVHTHKPVTSDTLYDLFTPFIPAWGGGIVNEIQKRLGIRQVVAVPFYINRIINGQPERELVGNLFAASRASKFTVRELEMLEVFGEQAAIGIKNARLYQRLEERRKLAQSFGMEAFTSSGYMHELGGLITPFQYLKILAMQKPETPEEFEAFYEEYQATIKPLLPRLNEMQSIIENLSEPWQHHPASDAVLQVCVQRAVDKGVNKVLRDRDYDRDRVSIYNKVADLPKPISLSTSKDMLTQAFVVVLQNSVEAIVEYNEEKGSRHGEIRIEADWIEQDNQPYIQVVFYDNGIGMKPEMLRRVYELGASTKTGHRGFGLLWTRDYIEGLGGKIQIISRRRAGTVVQIELPA